MKNIKTLYFSKRQINTNEILKKFTDHDETVNFSYNLFLFLLPFTIFLLKNKEWAFPGEKIYMTDFE